MKKNGFATNEAGVIKAPNATKKSASSVVKGADLRNGTDAKGGKKTK